MDDATAAELARRVWTRAEAYHAITYFSPECLAAYVDAGLKGFWRGYFAGRSAPFGAIGAGPIAASFHGFRPDFVDRALPSIWELITPEAAIEARLTGADATLRRIMDVESSKAELAEAASLLREAFEGADVSGRPIYAANAALAWPTEPHLAVWHGATLLREHRGDGHVAALTAAGLDGAEANVLRLAVADLPLDVMASVRGWDEDDWTAARARLVERELVDDTGATAAGTALYADIETTTDRLATGPIRRIGEQAAARLVELLDPWADAIGAAGDLPYPNPIGVPRPN
ncbi:MAG: hypothetical protein AAGD18_23025 [Actinomycetota bacterium]